MSDRAETAATLPTEIREIAILRALVLGDLLCAVPMFRSIRHRFPGAGITLIGLPWARSFVERFNGYLDDFVECYKPGKRGMREESDRFHRFSHDELVARDKASLDIFWLRDESLEDTDNLPPPGVIAAEIVEDLEAALAEFTELAESLQGIGVEIEE